MLKFGNKNSLLGLLRAAVSKAIVMFEISTFEFTFELFKLQSFVKKKLKKT